jgi:hypothetical protein
MSPQGFQYGLGSAGSGGRIPTYLAEVPANVGNVDFKLGVANARGGAPATLLVGLAPTATVLSGVNLNVLLNGNEMLVPLALNGAAGTAGAGYGTLALTVPNVPGLAGITLFSQWFVWDAGVAGGIATSRGAEIRFF